MNFFQQPVTNGTLILYTIIIIALVFANAALIEYLDNRTVNEILEWAEENDVKIEIGE